ncbi:hypothetical protein [Sphingomonas sanxanigenens]|uniref:Uncharacterized protein n=1 Tax=Sphingomonas sanxanigenens DSM 19645 = NX02 TaxID=1123269 RepID=W0AH55_9SPHN|nr:hypothetical protein [Sphingomonas sanxanigenens]AHE55877.1 hypothetical protein NX02_21190 [Sphingomonas sanxanigenens DSM 19645 = NX02]
MLGLFGPKRPIDGDAFEWMLATIKWLLRTYDGVAGLHETRLVLPTTDFFPTSAATGHALAEEIFDRVRSAAGMLEWRCRLMPGDPSRPMQVARGFALKHESFAPAGTFIRADDRDGMLAIIRYNPNQLATPPTLVATFAHELAHYLLSAARDYPPGGRDLKELATDLTAVFLGFGIFMANGAKSFRAFQSFDESGWESSRQGYLSEAALVTALAIVERLSGRSPRDAAPWLKPHLASDLAKADAYLSRRHPDLARDIEAIDLDAYRAE